MTKFQKIALAGVLVLAVLAALYQCRQARDARAEVQKLRAKQSQSDRQIADLQDSLASKSNQLADLLAENSRLKGNPNQTELLKLRGEVTRLRPLQQDVVTLQKMLQQSSAGLPTWKSNELANAGRANPIDALQTYLYSSQNTNTAEIGNSVVGDDTYPPSPEALQNFINDEHNHPQVSDGMAPYRILSETWIAPDKVQVELNASMGGGGWGVSVPFTLRNINGEWKLVIFNVRDQNGNGSHLGFVNDSPGQ
jgi:hypothetical protein